MKRRGSVAAFVLLAALAWAETATAQTTTVTFDNPAPSGSSFSLLNGVFQGIDFGTGLWRWESAYNADPTNHIFFDSQSGTSRTFRFSPAPRILASMRVFTTGASAPTGTLTLSDDQGQTVTRTVTTGSMQVVTTGWAQASTVITVTFTSGWNLGIDDITYSVGGARIGLVSARDHIEGSFLGNHAVYADHDRIYLASARGTLFVLARDRSADFPLLETIQTSTAPLVGVRGDRRRLYVVDSSGVLRVYRKDNPLVLVSTTALSTFAESMALGGGNIYISTGGKLAVDEDHVYLSVPAIAEGSFVLEFDKTTLTSGLTYDATLDPNTTLVFDREDGQRIATISPGGGANLYVDRKILVQTIPGCCGTGIWIDDPETFTLLQFIDRRFTNTAARRGRWLIAGNEAGQIDLFDLGQNPSPLVSSVSLPQLTGHTNPEDVEIRAVWTDRHDNLIFAGSSWGNDRSRGPFLPSFFVLELVGD